MRSGGQVRNVTCTELACRDTYSAAGTRHEGRSEVKTVEGRFQFGANFEQATVLCGQSAWVHFQKPREEGTGDTRMLVHLPCG